MTAQEQIAELLEQLSSTTLSSKAREELSAVVKELTLRDRKECYSKSFRTFAEECLTTLTKRGELVPLKLNKAQLLIDDAINDMLEEKGFAKIITVKARQTGISTYVAGRTLWRCDNTPNQKAALVAHVADTSKAVHEKNKDFHANCPPEYINPFTKDTEGELRLLNGSSIKAYTAKSPEAGRGITGQIFHGSEVAFWPQAEKTYNAIIQAISKGPGSEVFLESTANGIGDWFHGMWENAKKEVSKPEEWNGYRAIFIPWFVMDDEDDPNSYLVAASEMPSDYTLTDEEVEFKEKYGLKDNQILWRRQMINEMGKYSFAQEYPSNDEEAFMAEGHNVFDVSKLLEVKTRASSQQKYDEETTYFMPTREGKLNVYYPRQGNMRYVIGADPAGGVGQDGTALVIIDEKKRVVATMTDNQLPPADFGVLLDRLGRDYNQAYIIVEQNNHGGTTIQSLVDKGYPNLYKRQRLDDFTKTITEVPGFYKTKQSKLRVIEALRQAFAEDKIELNCPLLVNEMKSFVAKSDEKMEKSTGSSDDLVDACCLAVFAWETEVDNIYKMKTWKDTISFIQENPDTTNWM